MARCCGSNPSTHSSSLVHRLSFEVNSQGNLTSWQIESPRRVVERSSSSSEIRGLDLKREGYPRLLQHQNKTRDGTRPTWPLLRPVPPFQTVSLPEKSRTSRCLDPHL